MAMRKTNLAQILNPGVISGIFLLGCVAASLFVANSPWGSSFQKLLSLELGISSPYFHLKYPLLVWINDGLMAIFFLLVGLEIKHEIIHGDLASPKKAALPILAAIGGAITPALIYFAFNSGKETAPGWGIPMATDIAFVLAIITVLGKNIPSSLKVFLMALAIVDDLLAIVVITFFYNTELQIANLLYALLGVSLLLLFNLSGVKELLYYLIPGLFIWYFIHHSGIHASIAGVILAMTLPARTTSVISPVEKLKQLLTHPVNFIIMPLFALANTNIEFVPEMSEHIFSPLGLGIFLGLLTGKPLGIVFMSGLAIKARLAELPQSITLKHLLGAGILGGIGFTMSIFISNLSFVSHSAYQSQAKFSILLASIASAIAGSLFLISLHKK